MWTVLLNQLNSPKEGLMLTEKLGRLTKPLRAMIVTGERDFTKSRYTPISNFLVRTKRHCNGGRAVDAGLWLKKFCMKGGKMFITMSGAGSSFQMGITLSELIRKGFVAGISVTGANLEESLYRLVAHSQYAYIPDYEKLSARQEKELDNVGLRRITDTFLPEDESVRVLLEKFEELWRAAEKKGEARFWHEYFFDICALIDKGEIAIDPEASLDDCWLYQAWKHGVQIFVPGAEDSTMGNIFAYYSYKGGHPFLEKYMQEKPISLSVIRYGMEYTHRGANWYMDATKDTGLAFVQLGGGIAADFPICFVPHLKKDFLAGKSVPFQEKMIRPWYAFIEIYSSPTSFGSYSGAGGFEKITWSKLPVNAFIRQIFGDYTTVFPDIAALILGW
jgi:deoxyhypusine synthase